MKGGPFANRRSTKGPAVSAFLLGAILIGVTLFVAQVTSKAPDISTRLAGDRAAKGDRIAGPSDSYTVYLPPHCQECEELWRILVRTGQTDAEGPVRLFARVLPAGGSCTSSKRGRLPSRRSASPRSLQL